MQDELLDIKEVAAYLRCSVDTIWRRMKERREGKGNFPLPITPPGKKNFWNRIDVESWNANGLPTMSPTPAQLAAKRRITKNRFARLGIHIQ